MAKTYENWLIVSDIDGTLNTKFRTLNQKNLYAVERFKSLGGRFTLASGRVVPSMEKHCKRIGVNAPVVALNGAAIYDFSQNRVLSKHTIGEFGRNFTREIMEKFPNVEVGIFFTDMVFVVRGGFLAKGQFSFDKSPNVFCNIDAVDNDGWCKVIFWSDPITIKKVRSYCEARIQNNELNFMLTSDWSYEMLQGGVNKGSSALEIAGMLGIDKEHTAGIGDFYNDLELLQAVGFSACAGQAPRDIRESVDLVTCHCNHGSVAQLIDYIIKNF